MNDLQKILGLAVLSGILDLPWLYIQGPRVQDLIRDIQAERSMNVRLWGAIPVYLAIGYLVSQIHSAPRAFLAGMCTYAVYDFTQIVTFDKYPVWFALADSLWGGLLMSLVWWVGVHLGLTTPNR
jgi:uncharacterized membrane protein